MDRQRTVLIIDDDVEMLELITTYFKSIGWRVLAFESSPEMRQFLNQTGAKFDLIISDYSLRQGDGMGVFNEFRQLGDKTPFILMSAFCLAPQPVPAKHESLFFWEKTSGLKKLGTILNSVFV